MTEFRLRDLKRFNDLLDVLELRLGGSRRLSVQMIGRNQIFSLRNSGRTKGRLIAGTELLVPGWKDVQQQPGRHPLHLCVAHISDVM